MTSVGLRMFKIAVLAALLACLPGCAAPATQPISVSPTLTAPAEWPVPDNLIAADPNSEEYVRALESYTAEVVSGFATQRRQLALLSDLLSRRSWAETAAKPPASANKKPYANSE